MKRGRYLLKSAVKCSGDIWRNSCALKRVLLAVLIGKCMSHKTNPGRVRPKGGIAGSIPVSSVLSPYWGNIIWCFFVKNKINVYRTFSTFKVCLSGYKWDIVRGFFFVCIWVSVQRDAHSNTSLSQVGFYRYNRETTIDTNLYLPHPNSAYNVSLNRIRIHTTSQCGFPTARP